MLSVPQERNIYLCLKQNISCSCWHPNLSLLGSLRFPRCSWNSSYRAEPHLYGISAWALHKSIPTVQPLPSVRIGLENAALPSWELRSRFMHGYPLVGTNFSGTSVSFIHHKFGYRPFWSIFIGTLGFSHLYTHCCYLKVTLCFYFKTI